MDLRDDLTEQFDHNLGVLKKWQRIIDVVDMSTVKRVKDDHYVACWSNKSLRELLGECGLYQLNYKFQYEIDDVINFTELDRETWHLFNAFENPNQ